MHFHSVDYEIRDRDRRNTCTSLSNVGQKTYKDIKQCTASRRNNQSTSNRVVHAQYDLLTGGVDSGKNSGKVSRAKISIIYDTRSESCRDCLPTRNLFIHFCVQISTLEYQFYSFNLFVTNIETRKFTSFIAMFFFHLHRDKRKYSSYYFY